MDNPNDEQRHYFAIAGKDKTLSVTYPATEIPMILVRPPEDNREDSVPFNTAALSLGQFGTVRVPIARRETQPNSPS
jgi:hypothetical protein